MKDTDKLNSEILAQSPTCKSGRNLIPIYINSPKRKWELPNFGELYESRGMIFCMIWRDILVLYRQSGLGMIWIIIKPFAQMVAFTFLFGQLANLDSEGVPYAIFNFAALVPWTFFSNGLIQATTSVVSQGSMYSKLQFPRLSLPLTGLLSGTLDFLVQMAILFLMMVYFGIWPSWNLVWLPLFFMLLLIIGLGFSLILGTLNVMFRDVNQSLGVLLQFWMFISPVVYSSTEIPEKWQFLYSMNPMTVVINGFRWCLLNTQSPFDFSFFVSVFISLVFLVVGLLFFQRMENTFPDFLINP